MTCVCLTKDNFDNPTYTSPIVAFGGNSHIYLPSSLPKKSRHSLLDFVVENTV